MAPQLSFIIPVFNAAPFIGECLSSLCDQTLQDIEIICVDDRSDDSSLALLREYALPPAATLTSSIIGEERRMEKYEELVIEVILFDKEDVVMTSTDSEFEEIS